VWNALKDITFESFIFFYIGTADSPGNMYLTCLVGHHGAFPCCLFCGIKGQHYLGVPHYYPALLKPHDYQVTGCGPPDIDIKDINSGSSDDYDCKLIYILYSCHPTEYKQCHKETGISKPSLLSGLLPCTTSQLHPLLQLTACMCPL